MNIDLNKLQEEYVVKEELPIIANEFLPDDIWMNFFEFLPFEDVHSFELISKRHYSILHDIKDDGYLKLIAQKLESNPTLEILKLKIKDIKNYSLCHFVSKQLGFSKFLDLEVVQINLDQYKNGYSNYKLEFKNDKSILFGQDLSCKSCFIEVHATGSEDKTDRLAYCIYQLQNSEMWGLVQINKHESGSGSNHFFPDDDLKMKFHPENRLNLDKAKKHISSIFTSKEDDFKSFGKFPSRFTLKFQINTNLKL